MEFTKIDLHVDFDVIMARQRARELSREVGLSLSDQCRIATAVSEIARQTIGNHGRGSMVLKILSTGVMRGLECTCISYDWDRIPDSFPQEKVWGGVERLVDDFEMRSHNNNRVAIVMRKWRR